MHAFEKKAKTSYNFERMEYHISYVNLHTCWTGHKWHPTKVLVCGRISNLWCCQVRGTESVGFLSSRQMILVVSPSLRHVSVWSDTASNPPLVRGFLASLWTISCPLSRFAIAHVNFPKKFSNEAFDQHRMLGIMLGRSQSVHRLRINLWSSASV
jgi:hypothetical protein